MEPWTGKGVEKDCRAHPESVMRGDIPIRRSERRCRLRGEDAAEVWPLLDGEVTPSVVICIAYLFSLREINCISGEYP